MHNVKRWVLAATVAGSMLAGGAVGAVVFSAGPSSAATSTTATTTPTSPGYGVQPNGKFVPNENAVHEAGESAAREAQENAGQVPTVP